MNEVSTSRYVLVIPPLSSITRELVPFVRDSVARKASWIPGDHCGVSENVERTETKEGVLERTGEATCSSPSQEVARDVME
jgi:hypothetical protein